MDVVILAVNSKYIHSSLAPWYLKSAISDLSVSSVVLEHTVNEDINKVIEDVSAHSPSVLAISVYIWNVKYTYALIEGVKEKLPNLKIILGGPEVSYNSGDVLACSGVDYVICGEGEVPFNLLCRKLILNEDVKLIGVSSSSEIANPYVGVGTPKTPYTNEYFKNLNNRIAYFESSRGCPYSCAYCLSGRCEGMRFFDLEYVRENIVRLANSGSKTIKFVDRTFNADRRRAREVFSFLIENSGVSFPRDVCFHFELSGDLIDDETINLLASAHPGLFQFEIGIQSFFSPTIDAIHRSTESEILKNRIKRLVEMGNAHIHTDLIAGLPYENYDNFINSFNQAYNLGANMLQLGFLKILHGTELEDRAKEYGFAFSSEPPYEVYETPWISKAEIQKLKIAESALDRLHNSGRFKRTLSLCVRLFENAYAFFLECGNVIFDNHSLNDMTNALYLFLCAKFPSNAEEIRDAMVCDRLATNSSKGLPKELYRADARIPLAKKLLNQNSSINKRRNIAVLYSAQKVVYAIYDKKNNLGEFPLEYIDFSEVQYEKN